MDRLITLGVGTDGVEDYASTYADVSELARALGSNHSYLSVSAQLMTEQDEDPEPEGEEDIIGNKLYFDESTMITVKRAISQGLYESSLDDPVTNVAPDSAVVTHVVNLLQNAGILFRERPNSRDES